MQEKISVEDAKRELTMILLYLSRFTYDYSIEDSAFFAWKGFDFNILNKLAELDFIMQGQKPSRRKTIVFTDEGIEKAKELLQKYGIEDIK